MVQWRTNALLNAAQRFLLSKGHPPEDAGPMVDVMSYAAVRRNSQGFEKLLLDAGQPPVIRGPIQVVDTRFRTQKVVHANGHHAMPAVRRATLIAAEIALKEGSGVVVVKGASTSSGALGYYARMGADKGCLTEVMASTIPLVALPDGAARVIGTNPTAVGIPVPGSDSVVADYGISKISFMEVLIAIANGVELPDGVAVDCAGNPATDPKTVKGGDALRPGALLPRGAFGFSIGIMNLLACAVFAGQEEESEEFSGSGHMVKCTANGFAARPERIPSRVGSLRERLRRLPGDVSQEKARETGRRGTIQVSDAVNVLLEPYQK